jgi:predicted metalloprotease
MLRSFHSANLDKVNTINKVRRLGQRAAEAAAGAETAAGRTAVTGLVIGHCFFVLSAVLSAVAAGKQQQQKQQHSLNQWSPHAAADAANAKASIGSSNKVSVSI